MNVLLIEDDVFLSDLIGEYLTSKGYEVTTLFDGSEAIECIDANSFDMYIVDINIPNVNGLEIIKYIRQIDLDTPTIIITASIELENIKTAFENGCDEYIKKPFYLEELGIRINKLLNKKNISENLIKISHSTTYSFEYEELTVDGKIVKLRKKERKLLEILLKNINKTVSTESIENYVWENEIRESYPLRALVSDLRKKLKKGEELIYVDIGRGYRFDNSRYIS